MLKAECKERKNQTRDKSLRVNSHPAHRRICGNWVLLLGDEIDSRGRVKQPPRGLHFGKNIWLKLQNKCDDNICKNGAVTFRIYRSGLWFVNTNSIKKNKNKKCGWVFQTFWQIVCISNKSWQLYDNAQYISNCCQSACTDSGKLHNLNIIPPNLE